MKKISALIALLLITGCASMKSLEDTGSAPTYGTKSSGDSFTSANHNELYNGVVDNDSRLDTIEGLTGPVFSDGDGTYTDMSAISSTELGYLDGVTSNIQDQIDAAGSGAIVDEAVSTANFDGDTTEGASQDALENYFLLFDTDLDGDIDNIDATLLATKEDLLVNSAGLAGAISDEEGTGVAVFNVRPDINAPALYLNVQNNSGGPIQALNGVYVTGATGGLTTVSPADKDIYDQAHVLCITTSAINNSASGKCYYSGVIVGDTSSMTEGNELYIGDNGALDYSGSPAGPYYTSVGFVRRQHASAGEIVISIHHPYSSPGDITKVGTPAQYQAAYWTGDGTLAGKTLSADTPLCSDSNGEIDVCSNLTDLAVGESTIEGYIFDSDAETVAGAWTLNRQRYTVHTSEPSDEQVGDLFIADNDTWDPASYTGTNDYLVICTATGSPGTYLPIRDMVTGALLSGGLSGMPFIINVPIIEPASGDAIYLNLGSDTLTITSCGAIVDPGDSSESVVTDIQECDTNYANCTTILSATITAANTKTAGTVSDSSVSNVLKIVLGTVTGTVSTEDIYILGTRN